MSAEHLSETETQKPKPRLEGLLSARQFFQPQLAGEQIAFISDLSGRLSLYRMRYGGSLPEPLLPPQIALQNPHLLETMRSFCVFPKTQQVLVMIDQDGDERYQPMSVPLTGGFPQPAFGEALAGQRVFLALCDPETQKAYLIADSLEEARVTVYEGDLEKGTLLKLGDSPWSLEPIGVQAGGERVLLVENYTIGDDVLYLWQRASGLLTRMYGTPLEDRQPQAELPLTHFFDAEFTQDGSGALLGTALFSDTFGLAYLDLQRPDELQPVEIRGLAHSGPGILKHFEHLYRNRYLLLYNIDGVSWAYEAAFDPEQRQMQVLDTLTGQGDLADGVIEAIHYDEDSDSFAISFSTATSPTQIYTLETDRKTVTAHTHERLLGIPSEWLAQGEDAGYTSFDGTHIPARLYLPAEALGYSGPRPLVYYVHGGPQSQERPDFTWFSMPLIQFLTLNGFAVFVPNVRGSTGYGLNYTKQVDRDWGGKDRLDHVHAMTQVLPLDERLDVKRAGVVGRSYGGYMTLMLAGRHPELWSAAVDMFGPFDLLTFLERIPPTWKPYYYKALGHPEEDREFLVERSPRTYLDALDCPLLVVQGQNDPRVVLAESSDLVEYLQAQGKSVEFLVFENEGHDVLKFENRLRVYQTITDFFKDNLKP